MSASSGRSRSMYHALLATLTGEPIQPVRLFYSIPGRAFVTRRLATLACMAEDPEAQAWDWLYEAEAASIAFATPYAALPRGVHPLRIGTLRFPGARSMTIQVRSFDRAIAAAKFFAKVLGPRVILRRARVVNRWFEAHEAMTGPEAVDRQLDEDVTVIDPEAEAQQIEARLAGARTEAEKMQAFARYVEERRQHDLPLVEDFPLEPDDVDAGFCDLGVTLHLRLLRAGEHWNGNTDVTLHDIIERLCTQGPFGPV